MWRSRRDHVPNMPRPGGGHVRPVPQSRRVQCVHRGMNLTRLREYTGNAQRMLWDCLRANRGNARLMLRVVRENPENGQIMLAGIVRECSINAPGSAGKPRECSNNACGNRAGMLPECFAHAVETENALQDCSEKNIFLPNKISKKRFEK